MYGKLPGGPVGLSSDSNCGKSQKKRKRPKCEKSGESKKKGESDFPAAAKKYESKEEKREKEKPILYEFFFTGKIMKNFEAS